MYVNWWKIKARENLPAQENSRIIVKMIFKKNNDEQS